MTEEKKENTEAAGAEGGTLKSTELRGSEGEVPVKGEGHVKGEGPSEGEGPVGSGRADEKRITGEEGGKRAVFPGGEGRNWESERQYFRVFFPVAETPTLTVEGVDYEVIDASEKGIKFKKPEGKCLFEADQPVSCKFTLKTGESCSVKGKVLRVLPSAVVLLLTEGISFRLLMSEQRRFISIYKHIYKV
ncbi:hypothetical protein MNBD_DELTA02-40 [hydrothermal vent metagenome]|uniref:PilZ domain-containing protein n=1 Tax=hydrothermal vent metagenome TaxID=652676 RepID=A0A3B0VGZ7_9ZZZZ